MWTKSKRDKTKKEKLVPLPSEPPVPTESNPEHKLPNRSGNAPWHLTLETTKGTLLEIPDLFPLINSFNSAGIIKKEYKFKSSFNCAKTPTPEDMRGPWGIVVARNGDVFVVDHSGGLVHLFDHNHNFVKSFTKPNGKALQNPIGIALDKAENIYVTEYCGQVISVFDRSGTFLKEFGHGLVLYPYDLTLDHQENILVCDSGNSRIQFFTQEGVHFKSFGKSGDSDTDDDYFRYPVGVRITPQGTLIVLDNTLRCLKIFDPNYKLIRKITDKGLIGPFSFDIDGLGNLLVADFSAHAVLVFNQQGELLQIVGKKEVRQVEAVTIDRMGNLLITEMGNKRVSVWG